MNNPVVVLLVICVLGMVVLMHIIESRQIGKDGFDRQSDIDKYKSYIAAHYWGAYLFLIGFGVLWAILVQIGVMPPSK